MLRRSNRLKRAVDPEDQPPPSKQQKPDLVVKKSQRSLTDLPNEVLVKVFSQIGSVPFKCKLRLVNKRWNGLLRHADSFAASSSLNLSIQGTSWLNRVVKDESGQLFPDVKLSVRVLFKKLLPNLKSVTSLRLNVAYSIRHHGRKVSPFIDFLITQHPANIQLSSVCIDCDNRFTDRKSLSSLIGLYKSTLHSLTGNALGSMAVLVLPEVGLCPNMSELEMTYRDHYTLDTATYEQMMNGTIEFFKVLTERKQKIQLTINANDSIKTEMSLMVKMLESLPKYDECSVNLRLHDCDMAFLQYRGHEFRDLSWLGAVEDFIVSEENYPDPDSLDAFRLLVQLLPSMRRLRSLPIKRAIYDSEFPLQFDDQALSESFYHWLITESPAGVSVDLEFVTGIQLDQLPELFTQHQQMEEDVVKLNTKYKDYDVSIEQEFQTGYEIDKENRREFHIRCCLKIKKGGEELRQVRFDVY